MYPGNSNCETKLKIQIKGKYFTKNAEVKFGSREASSVNKKDSKNLTATFCMTKLMDDQTDHKKTLTVTNPDTDKAKYKKKIDLTKIGFELNLEDFNTQTVEGIKNIQTALAQKGYLDAQYITGSYGELTKEAIRKFQKDNGLEQTGTVGPLTKEKLKQ